MPVKASWPRRQRILLVLLTKDTRRSDISMRKALTMPQIRRVTVNTNTVTGKGRPLKSARAKIRMFTASLCWPGQFQRGIFSEWCSVGWMMSSQLKCLFWNDWPRSHITETSASRCFLSRRPWPAYCCGVGKESVIELCSTFKKNCSSDQNLVLFLGNNEFKYIKLIQYVLPRLHCWNLHTWWLAEAQIG